MLFSSLRIDSKVETSHRPYTLAKPSDALYSISAERADVSKITLKMEMELDIFAFDRLLLTINRKQTHSTIQSSTTKYQLL